MHTLAISVVLAASAATSAMADQAALAYCQAQANGIVYTGGGKTGYAALYTETVNTCLASYRGGYVVGEAYYTQFRQPRNTPSVVGHCPASIGPFYRGTLYCVD